MYVNAVHSKQWRRGVVWSGILARTNFASFFAMKIGGTFVLFNRWMTKLCIYNKSKSLFCLFKNAVDTVPPDLQEIMKVKLFYSICLVKVQTGRGPSEAGGCSLPAQTNVGLQKINTRKIVKVDGSVAPTSPVGQGTVQRLFMGCCLGNSSCRGLDSRNPRFWLGSAISRNPDCTLTTTQNYHYTFFNKRVKLCILLSILQY